MAGFPLNKTYLVRSPDTGVVHVSQAWDSGGYGAATIVHATWCNVELTSQWQMIHETGYPTCLMCIAEAYDEP